MDIVNRNHRQLAAMNLAEITRLITTYMDPPRMVYLVVGDAKRQIEEVAKRGYGNPTLLNREGNRL